MVEIKKKITKYNNCVTKKFNFKREDYFHDCDKIEIKNAIKQKEKYVKERKNKTK